MLNEPDQYDVDGGTVLVFLKTYDDGRGNEVRAPVAVFVPKVERAVKERQRRLKVLDGWTIGYSDDGALMWWESIMYGPDKDGPLTVNRKSSMVTATHRDDSFTTHLSLLEAHDALVSTGSVTPFFTVDDDPHSPDDTMANAYDAFGSDCF